MNTILSGAVIALGCGFMIYEYVYKNSLKYLVSKYEKDNNCKLIVIKQKLNEMIDFNLALKLQKIFNGLSKDKNIDIILHTLGGDFYATIAICNLFKTFQNKIRIFVPNYAYSAGTMLSLMSTELYANNYTQFGPCDVQLSFNEIGTFSSKDYLKLQSNKDRIKLIIDFATSINRQMNTMIDDQNNKIKEKLFSGVIPHGTSLSVNDMKFLDINIKCPCPTEINKIFDLF